MKKLPFLLFAALAICASAQSGDVYKWTDEHGKTQYGDKVPEDRKATAKPVNVTQGTPQTEAQRAEAQARLDQHRAKLKETLTKNSNAQGQPATALATSAANGAKPDEKLTCQEAWKRYDESYACFNPYRGYKGYVRPEAYEHCAPMLQPDPC